MLDRNILEITGLLGPFNNPAFPHPDNQTWTADLFHGKTFLTNDSPVWEWTPLLDQQNELDTRLVGITGTAIYPDKGAISDTDNPFYHPFDFDFEFFIAPDPQYVSLLAPNNCLTGDKIHPDYKSAITKANNPSGLNLGVRGVLGLETDQRLVPAKYRSQDSDRVAVFGRWIVDTGHDDFHTEIHPPLLLVSARSPSQNATHSTVVGRPYLVSQEFGDGALRQHLIKEIAKIPTPIPGVPGSTRVEAHPHIKNMPFSGIQIMSYLVRPASPRPSPDHVLQVKYHFTVRSGVIVQLINDTADNAIKVVIKMDDTAYKPPPLPPRHDWDISLDDLDKLKPGLGSTIKNVLIKVALAGAILGADPADSGLVYSILSQGIRTDRYDAPQAGSVHDTEVTTVIADKLSASSHYSVDDGQPFPVYGFVDVQWVTSSTFHSLKEFLNAKGVHSLRALQPSGTISLRTLMGL